MAGSKAIFNIRCDGIKKKIKNCHLLQISIRCQKKGVGWSLVTGSCFQLHISFPLDISSFLNQALPVLGKSFLKKKKKNEKKSSIINSGEGDQIGFVAEDKEYMHSFILLGLAPLQA